MLDYILDIDHSYPPVLPYTSRSTTPPASPLRLPSLIANEFGTGQHIFFEADYLSEVLDALVPPAALPSLVATRK